MFTIEKDIPVVPRNSYLNGNLTVELKKVLGEMETGDSFAYSDATSGQNINKTIRSVARQLGFKVTVRKVEDGKYRAWKL